MEAHGGRIWVESPGGSGTAFHFVDPAGEPSASGLRDSDLDVDARRQAGKAGLFLAFEGVEGSGKTTQAARLAAALRDAGREVIVAREPGATPLGERIRALVLDARRAGIPARSELFLMLAARAAFVEQVVRPALAAGRVVIADRFELSTLAYQGAGRGLPAEEIRRCNRLATGGLRPRRDGAAGARPREGARRQRAAAKARDRMEREEEDFHRGWPRDTARCRRRWTGLVVVDARGAWRRCRRGCWRRWRRASPKLSPRRGYQRQLQGPAEDPDSLTLRQ